VARDNRYPPSAPAQGVIEEQYVGGNQEQEQEAAHKADVAFELDLDKASSRDMRKLIDAQTERINDLKLMMEKLVNRGQGLTASAEEVREFTRSQMNRKKYEQLVIRHNDPTKLKRCITILLHTHDDPNQNFPAWVEVNGKGRNIPRGVPVRVSIAELVVLDNAVMESDVPVGIHTGVEGDTRRVFVQSYPYTPLDESGESLLAEANAA
jgi:hypothetical protein